ncbi:MAG: hypothetical protein J5606_03885 [Bacteroidales bacterium]|nr:hypothetical protein [Bacteroidales bacterium]MBO4738683.1 hypothetical protein [Bacteroidales bacterium]
MKKSFVCIISLWIVIVSFYGCNPKVGVPSYLYIDSLSFSCLESQGTSSCRIPDIRVVVNGDDRGSYVLPATVPVLQAGNSQVRLWTVVYKNGLPQQRMVNYLYSMYETNVVLRTGKIDTLRPSFSYVDGANFYFIEDFESAGNKFAASGKAFSINTDSTLLLHIKGEQNTRSGIITFDESDTNGYFEMRTISHVYLVGTTTTFCFLELNCSSTQTIEVGMYINNTQTTGSRQRAIANITATSDRATWRKLYINLSEEMANMGTYETNFDVYIKGYAGSGKDTFLLDNIKLVYM